MNALRYFGLVTALVMGHFSTNVLALTPDDLIYVTEEYPNSNYMEDGKLKGITVDALELMLINMGANTRRDQFRLLSWARAYDMALNQENTVIFSMAKTKSREPLFKWVGPVKSPRKLSLFGNALSPAINDQPLTFINDQNLTVAVIKDDISEKILLEQGVNQSNIVWAASAKSAALMLDANRVNYWAYSDSAYHVLTEIPLPPDSIIALYNFPRTRGTYIGFHIDTPDELVKQFQKELDNLKEKGIFQAIESNY